MMMCIMKAMNSTSSAGIKTLGQVSPPPRAADISCAELHLNSAQGGFVSLMNTHTSRICELMYAFPARSCCSRGGGLMLILRYFPGLHLLWSGPTTLCLASLLLWQGESPNISSSSAVSCFPSSRTTVLMIALSLCS
jgi:hypothetical protein